MSQESAPPGRAYAVWASSKEEDRRGLDIHGGLRIRFDVNGWSTPLPLARGRAQAVCSAEPGTDVIADVKDYIAQQQHRLMYAQEWLALAESQLPSDSDAKYTPHP